MYKDYWKTLLNDFVVIEEYGKIDEVNNYPFNHGLVHVTNVCHIMKNLCIELDISGDIEEALLIACVFHDIGQVDGRDSHGLKAKEFIMKNYKTDLMNNPFYEQILSAVECHDDDEEKDLDIFCKLVQFADKMDFTKDRLEKDYLERFGNIIYEKIDAVNFIYDDYIFGIDIITNQDINFSEELQTNTFFNRVINITKALAKKIDRKAIICLNGINCNID